VINESVFKDVHMSVVIDTYFDSANIKSTLERVSSYKLGIIVRDNVRLLGILYLINKLNEGNQFLVL